MDADPTSILTKQQKRAQDHSYEEFKTLLKHLKRTERQIEKLDLKLKLMTQKHKKIRLNGKTKYIFLGKPEGKKRKKKRQDETSIKYVRIPLQSERLARRRPGKKKAKRLRRLDNAREVSKLQSEANLAAQ